MPFDVDAEVIANTRLSSDYNVLALAAPDIARALAPGQFVMVKPTDGLEPLLRRPFSVFEVLRDERSREIGLSLLNKRVGVGTRLLYDAKIGARIEFARGFPSRFTLSLPKLRKHGGALFAAAPALCEYQPLKYSTGWEKFVKSPLLGRLSGLDLGHISITVGRAAALLASPRCAGLRFLSIGVEKLSVKGVDLLSTTTHLAFPSSVFITSPPCSQPLRDRPWGGVVHIQGRIYNTGLPGSVRYRVRYNW